ncbi:MAG TPA: hypothetical protein VLY20_10920 [Nitrospiria bacterium]|nr:hypothetical protein [Nitrospiria bacterium]
MPVLLSSCIIVYRGLPARPIGKSPLVKSYDLLSYQIAPFPFPDEGGEAALYSVFNNQTPFANTAAVSAMPLNGVYCRVDVIWKRPAWTTEVFHYLSLLTLTALPSWNVRETYVVRYRLFVDGDERKTFEYKIMRKSGLWLGLLPVSWMNWLTYSQADVFESTTLQFFEDAKPIFSTLGPRELIIN